MTPRPRWIAVVGWFAGSRIVIAALGIIGVATFATLLDGQPVGILDNLSAFNPQTVWHKWDSLWYERIVQHGYGYQLDTARGQALGGYFPLYPLTVALLLRLAPFLSFFWVATIFSNVVTLVALWLVARYLVDRDDLTGRVLAIIMTSAGSFYLSIPYAESLFLLLVAGTLIATRRRRYELAALLAGLSATTRVHGLALVAVPVIACWLDGRLASRARYMRAAVALALFAAPFLIYLAFLAQVQGSWSAFIARQELWGNPSPYPLHALTGFFEFPRRISNWLHGGFWFLYVGLLIRYWRKLPVGDVLFCAGALLISTQYEAFHGTYRYVVPLLPLTFALAEDDARVRHTLIGINLVFGVLMLLAFVTNSRLTV